MGACNPAAMSLVRWLPPTLSTAVCFTEPPWNNAMSVVPPPMSTSATPTSFSSWVSVASADASGSSTKSATLSPVRLQHLMTFWAAATAPVTTCTLASSRTPAMPRGSTIPPWPSRANSWGSTWSTSRSMGMATALAASMTRSTSASVTSLFLTATTPWLLNPRM